MEIELFSKEMLNAHEIDFIDADGNMHMMDGRVWMRGKCMNSIVSGCKNDIDWEHGGCSYCRRCAAEYDEECEREKRQEVFVNACKNGESLGILPPNFDKYHPPSFYAWQSQAYNQMRAEYSRNVWLTAEHGNGKTAIGMRLLSDALHNGATAAYIDCAGTGLSELCRNHNARAAIGTARLLVLDDISKIYITEYAAAELHNLLSERHAAKLRTIVISEWPGKQFAGALRDKTDGRFGASTVDRLSFKGAQCLAIEMRGENIRRM